MKKCIRCLIFKNLKSYYKKTDKKNMLFPECIACFKKRVWKYYDATKEKRRLYARNYIKNNYQKKLKSLAKDDSIKVKARISLRVAIRKGNIKKTNICINCSKSPTYCHHADYSKPFQFIELCSTCHGKIHRTPAH